MSVTFLKERQKWKRAGHIARTSDSTVDGQKEKPNETEK